MQMFSLPPIPLQGKAARLFDEQAWKMGLDPQDRWVGGYVDYEWNKLRPLLAAYEIEVSGKRVLEFGCNFGASSIVLAFLGAQVDGVDVSSDAVELACRNAARYGRSDIKLSHVADSRRLPHEDGQFDLVLCNSVLEYVSPSMLAAVIDEIHRVLRPQGQLLITGTSSRLAPKEVHSGRWFVNYLPEKISRWRGEPLQRGVDPFLLRRLLVDRFQDADAENQGSHWLRARAAVRGLDTPPALARVTARVASLLGIGPGWLAPNISALLRRDSWSVA
jgi:SAM-dependent methyltransferase